MELLIKILNIFKIIVKYPDRMIASSITTYVVVPDR